MDDGLGMNRDDALLCLERHATSKIQKAEDLAAIATMGFRGEALPSIASVSRMTITTRQRDADTDAATQVVINGGKIVEVKAAGSPPGTTVEVRQLFFNLPARRKFLRSEETEFAHIHHYLTLAALAHPQVAFTFVKDGRIIWQLPPLGLESTENPPVAAVRERMRSLIGTGLELLPVDFSAALNEAELPTEEASGGAAHSELRIWGLMGKPGISRSTREDQHLFVNRRPVENRTLNYALLEGYHTALMKGRFPVCCLFLEIDPALVDVNIHPAKREVKFHSDRAVRQIVTQAVRQTLLQYHSTPATAAPPSTDKATLVAKPKSEHEPIAKIAPPSPSLPNFPEARSFPIEKKPVPTPASVQPTAPAAQLPAATPQQSLPPVPKAPAAPVVAAGDPQPLLNVPLQLVGVIGKLYVVLESDRGLVLLDQHAAHERILFEQMLDRMEKQGHAPSQRLLLPETIELSARDTHFIRELLPTLTRLGVGLNEFGERTFLLDALPPFVQVSDSRVFVLQLIDELKAAGQEVNSMRLGEHTVAKTVCRHAVKANDPLAGLELENLVHDLRRCAMPYTCPHGRPTLIEMNYRELEKKFGRQQ
jgi:DNA mismatch repair protein MutL